MEPLYVIPETERNAAGLRKCLPAHPEIRFASLTGVDLGGNDTDEKIPIGHFLAHIEEFLSGGVQTDGSSVVRPGIASALQRHQEISRPSPRSSWKWLRR